MISFISKLLIFSIYQPWHHMRGSLSSQSYFVRNPTLAPQLEKTYESVRGFPFLHTLSNIYCL